MNVILIVMDTWRRSHAGCYGSDWVRTPNVDRFAERSAVFENAFFASYPTLPNRHDILTGRYKFPWRGWGGLDPADRTLPGVLGEAGRVSQFITDTYHHWGRDAGSYWRDFSGFELIRGQEEDRHITDADARPEQTALGAWPVLEQQHSRNVAVFRRDEEDFHCARVFREASRWVQHNAAHKDFFLMVDSFDPHEPWDPPKHYHDLYGDPDYDGRAMPYPQGYLTEDLTADEIRAIRANYAGLVTMADRWLGHFLDQVELMGRMDDTMIVLTTDHGTHDGAHGRFGKNWVLHDDICHVPLIVWHPEFGHGARPGQIVQPVDVFPTTLDAMGLAPVEGLHGQSLLPILRDPAGAPGRDAAIMGEFRWSAHAHDGEYHLIQGVAPSNPPLYSYSQIVSKWSSDDWGPFDGTRRRVGPKDANTGDTVRGGSYLFHLPSDPGEEKDILDEAPEEAKRLRELLAGNFRRVGVPEELYARFGL